MNNTAVALLFAALFMHTATFLADRRQPFAAITSVMTALVLVAGAIFEALS